MREPWRGAKIREFEQLRAGPSTVLLRVTGKPSWWRMGAGERPVLFTQAGVEVHRYSPLASPPDPKGILRAAYSVPAEDLKSETVFALLTADGSMISLPAPSPRARSRKVSAARTAAEPEPAAPSAQTETGAESDDFQEPALLPATDSASEQQGPVSDAPVPDAPVGDASLAWGAFQDPGLPSQWPGVVAGEADRRAASESDAEQAHAEAQALQGRIDELVAEVRDAASQLTESQARVEEAQRDAQSARAEAAQQVETTRREAEEQVQATREQAEREMAQAREQANQRVRQAEMEAERLQTELYHTEAQLHALQAETEIRVREAAAQADAAAEARFAETRAELETQVATAVAAQEALELEAQFLRDTREEIERELHDALDDVRKMRFERDELARQASAFDGVAIKARERATQAETALQRSQATLNELEVWRAELERRLTTTTSELGLARSTLADNDRQLRRLRGEQAEAEARAELAEAQVRALQGHRAGADQATTTSIERSELERMAQELAELRAQQLSSDADDETAGRRVAALEAERDRLIRETEQLSARVAAGGAAQPSDQHGVGAAEEPAEQAARVAELTRMAEEQAEAEAARELAEVDPEGSRPVA
jgi:chromosome segregation ATPase